MSAPSDEITPADLFAAVATKFDLESALVMTINSLDGEIRDDAELGAAVRQVNAAYFATSRARRGAEVGLPAQAGGGS